jgi:hypothetical protein
MRCEAHCPPGTSAVPASLQALGAVVAVAVVLWVLVQAAVILAVAAGVCVLLAVPVVLGLRRLAASSLVIHRPQQAPAVVVRARRQIEAPRKAIEGRVVPVTGPGAVVVPATIVVADSPAWTPRRS